MKFTLYQIDAFTDKVFSGNPAAVIPLENWIDESLMQKLALENNLSETGFFVPAAGQEGYEIRWFTPLSEINLCGHVTLASAYVLFEILKIKKEEIIFHSKSGKLTVKKDAQIPPSMGFRGIMDFPAWKPSQVYNYPGNLRSALGVDEILSIYKQRDLLVELKAESEVKNAKPDFSAIKKWGEKVIITAPGSGDVDFVSRFFAPSVGIDEDPVTGSAHSQLIPFWAEKLNRKTMHAKQLSSRGGELWVGLLGDRVTIAGQCAFYMKGEIEFA